MNSGCTGPDSLWYPHADKLVVSTSSSLLHTAVDLVNEPKLDKEIKSWLAFAAQKVVEVDALAKALSGAKDEVGFAPEFPFFTWGIFCNGAFILSWKFY